MAIDLQVFIKREFSNVGIVNSKQKRNAMSSKHTAAKS